MAVATVLFLFAVDEALHGILSAWLVVAAMAMAMAGTAQVLLLGRSRRISNSPLPVVATQNQTDYFGRSVLFRSSDLLGH